MRVLHVYRTYFPDPPGGLQEAIRHISLTTRAEGIDPHIFTLSPNPTPTVIDRPEGQVTRSKSFCAPASCNIGGPDAFLRFRSLVRQSDLIHYHFPWPFADVLHLTMAAQKPAILTYHSDIVRQQSLAKIYDPLMHRMLSSMRAIVSTSPAYAGSSPILTKLPPEKLHMIPLGIVDYSQHVIDEPCPLLEKFNLNNQPYFLSLGVLRYYKGLHNLVLAAAKVKARIIIAGDGPEGDNLKKLVGETGASNVFFTGQISHAEKVALLKNCRALILPSHVRSEAFGMVLVEASMFGKPMVCCEVSSGTSYVNENNVTGFVVLPNDPASLAEAMNKFLEDPTLAARMGQAARQRYEKLLSGKVMGEAYAKLYREVLAKAAPK